MKRSWQVFIAIVSVVIIAVAIIFLATCLAKDAVSIDAEKNKKLQTEVGQLNKQISDLQEVVNFQKAEIGRLSSISQYNGADTAPNVSTRTNTRIRKLTPSVTSQPLFGIFLGETLDSLSKRFNIYPLYIGSEDEEYLCKGWNVQNNNQNVEQLFVCTFDEKIYQINIQFTDRSIANYEAIKEQLEKKYNTKNKGNTLEESVFDTVIDGVEVEINLKYTDYMEERKVDLTYTHIPLMHKMFEEIQRRKAIKVGGEL